ncbi:MAG: ketoacyl-ACP synthase III [Phycisphaerae bacterium]|nr:ketoacyl-ACP synthase III [Phycisphaerae bacterium]
MTTDRTTATVLPPALPRVGVRIAGVGSALPSRVITNQLLSTIVETSDDWIVQRTGISERRMIDHSKGESNFSLSRDAMRRALDHAAMRADELDLLIVGTISGEMRCPSNACRVAAALGAGECPAFDLGAACCGFTYSLNLAHDLIKVGTHRAIGIVGVDTISSTMDYTNRAVCILFGDAAGAAVLRATDDTSKGILAQVNRADGSAWHNLYWPMSEADFPPNADRATARAGCLQMNGREIYKFAVKTFGDVIDETLTRAGVPVADVDMFVCHQSNARIIESARERFGIPEHKVYVNIDRVGNTSAGSVPLCLDELVRAGRVREGQIVMFVAFGAGLTWATSLWRM